MYVSCKDSEVISYVYLKCLDPYKIKQRSSSLFGSPMNVIFAAVAVVDERQWEREPIIRYLYLKKYPARFVYSHYRLNRKLLRLSLHRYRKQRNDESHTWTVGVTAACVTLQYLIIGRIHPFRIRLLIRSFELIMVDFTLRVLYFYN